MVLHLHGAALRPAFGLTPLTRGAEAPPPIRVLLLTGQNNHDWKATTPRIESILRAPVFKVTTTERFDQMQPQDIGTNDVLVSNWNNWGDKAEVKNWPEPIRDAFVKFVEQGKGLVIVHSEAAHFMIGQKSTTDRRCLGKETGHGPVHRFEVRIATASTPSLRAWRVFRPRMSSGIGRRSNPATACSRLHFLRLRRPAAARTNP
jgi:hypothetical protein